MRKYNDRAIMRRLIRDNKRQRAIIRAYRDELAVKEILAGLWKLVTWGLSNVADKIAYGTLKGISFILNKIPSGIGYVPIGIAKMLIDKIRNSLGSLPSTLGAKLLNLAKALFRKANDGGSDGY